MDVYGHLFKGAQGQLTQDLDDLIGRVDRLQSPTPKVVQGAMPGKNSTAAQADSRRAPESKKIKCRQRS